MREYGQGYHIYDDEFTVFADPDNLKKDRMSVHAGCYYTLKLTVTGH